MKKTSFRTLRNKLDKAVSQLVRKRGECERCGTKKNLQCSHIYGRRNLSVRWDLDNLQCLCMRCHLYFWHKEPIAAFKWLESVRTKKQLAALNRKANAVKKWTIKEMSELLEEIEAKLEE